MTPASGRLVTDPATGISLAAATVSVAATTPEGRYPVPIEITSADHVALPPLAVTVLVGQPGTFAVLRNNTGSIDDAGTHDEADLDDGGVSLSRQALAAAGLAPGARTTPSGLAFTWPDVPAGQPDNIGCDGSDLRLDNLPATAGRLSFVGTGANGDQQGTATLRYADGSTDVIDLSFTDWTISGGRGSLQFADEIVARTAYRNIAGSAREDVPRTCSPPSRSRFQLGSGSPR